MLLKSATLALAALTLATTAFLTGCGGSSEGATELKISSYEPTVELYKSLNPAFAEHYKKTANKTVTPKTDHGPSGKQARDIAAGKDTHIAALSVDFDIDQIVKAGLIDANWRSEYPNDAVPYYSAVIFMVRKANPKNIKDWEDLARPDVTSLAPNPKTGGGARWIYLSAYAHSLRKNPGDHAKAKEFVGKIYDDAILDPAMRGSTTRFIQQGEGDVLFGWENEILQVLADPSTGDKYERVVPSDSITIEVPIAIVDKNVQKAGVEQIAKDFVAFLFADEGQEIAAKFYNRPYKPEIAAKYKDKFAPLNLFKFSDHFKDWPTVMKEHFAEGAILDQVREKK